MLSLSLASNYQGPNAANIYGGVSKINWPSLSSPSSTGLNDIYSSASQRLGFSSSFNGNGGLVVVEPTDQIFYNQQDGRIYIQRSTSNGNSSSALDNSNLLFSGLSGDQLSGYNYGNSQIGDQLFYDQTTGKIYVQRQGANGPEYVELNNLGNTTNTSSASSNAAPIQVDAQKEVRRISSSGQTFAALNVPNGLTTSPIDVNGVFPGFGDKTGASIAASMYCEAGIYTQLQKTISIINYLNTAPGGTSPNPGFSYIAGRPPYAQDTPEGRRAQDQVFAMLRTNIITQLTRVAEQLRDAMNGIRQQRTLAETYKKTQDGDVKKFVDAAFGGGGGGG